jgi:hypothetical protein
VTFLIDSKDPAQKFTTGWQVVLNEPFAVRQTQGTGAGATLLNEYSLKVDLPKGELKNFKELVLVDPRRQQYRLTIPSGKAEPVQPSVEEQTFTVSQFDAVKLSIKGKELGKVASITADGEILEGHTEKDGTILAVYLRGTLTRQPRTIALVLRDETEKVIGSVDVAVRRRASGGNEQ